MVERRHWRDDPQQYEGHNALIDKALRTAYYREPFAPYEIVLKDGRRLSIDEPMQIAFPPAFPAISVALDKAEMDGFRDVFNGPFLYFEQIGSIDLLEERVEKQTV